MKKILLSFFFSLSIVSWANAQQSAWQWVNPLPQGNALNGLWSFNKDSAIAVGAYGTIVHTTNGGQTWQVKQAASGFTGQLFAVRFTTNMLGWATGEEGQILKTTDGGDEWYIYSTPTYQDFYALDFTSNTNGWVVGRSGALFATTNGGVTWASKSSGTTVSLYSVTFTNDSTGWIAGATGKILKTTDAGNSWIPQNSGVSTGIFSLNFISSQVGWAVGASGVILKTFNGGTNWVPQFGGGGLNLYSVDFVNATTGWIAGAYGSISKTTDGGSHWFPQVTDSYNDIYSLNMASSNEGWVVGDYGIMYGTISGGTTWNNESTGPKNQMFGLSFPTTNTGYAVGDEGSILKTTNSGLSWQKQNSHFFLPLYDVDFVSSSTGWAVGDSAIIIKTTDGGVHWTNQTVNNEISLYSVDFVNASVGWAVGDEGTILKTVTGGGFWAAQVSNTTTTLQKVKFVNENVGWAVGYSGVVVKTTDGGTTWEEQFSNTSESLYGLSFVNENVGFASGDFGVVISTVDGGNTWDSHEANPDQPSLYDIAFLDALTGWAVGDDGIIVKTSDGGNSWFTQESGTINLLLKLQLVKNGAGGVLFAAGDGGTILCSSIHPLPMRTWTGLFDSLWFSGGNWDPLGIPEKLDSVVIPVTAKQPVIRQASQQINISSLRIASGAKLSIGPELAQLNIKNSIDISGTLSIDDNATPEILTGYNFNVAGSGKFSPGKSTVTFVSKGQARGTFYNFVLKEGANVQSVGNIEIKKTFSNLAKLTLRPIDTLTLRNADPNALQGSGFISAGTIRRAIQPGSTLPYRFESPVTFLQFLPGGTLPDTILMTTYPNTLASGFKDSLFVRRYYSINASGGNNYNAYMSLGYDTSESKIAVDELALFKDSSGVLLNMGKTDFLDSDLTAVMLDSVKRFSNWYLGFEDYIPKHPYQFFDSLFIHDAGTGGDTLFFGSMSGATDSIDFLFDEVQLPPKPPAGTFDARWSIPSTLGSGIDILDVFRGTKKENMYNCSIQPSISGSLQIGWNKSMLAIGSFFLRDSATQGGQFNVNMKLQSSYTITNPAIKVIQIVHSIPKYYSFNRGWNMISLPLTSTSDRKKTTLFPTSASIAYKYAGGYFAEDTLRNGPGYWLKFTAAQSIPLDGFTRLSDTVNVVTGWNMIGSVSYSVAIGNIVQIPSNISGGNYYGYSGGYNLTDSIRPAKGYWVKISTAGKLVLNSTGPLVKQTVQDESLEELHRLNTVTVHDVAGNQQILYFGTPASSAFDEERFELPPAPPQGIFDARFNTQKIVSTDDKHISTVGIQSAQYPVTMSWHITEQGLHAIQFTDAVTGKVLARGSGNDGSVQITNTSVSQVNIEVTGSGTAPKEFSLKQNYPNPFNPVTTIEFELPVQSDVSLKIFNLLGQQVAELLNHTSYAPGTHNTTFDASNLGSGMYFYQLSAKGTDGKIFHQVRKMLLIK